MLVAVLAIFVVCWLPKLVLDFRAASRFGEMNRLYSSVDKEFPQAVPQRSERSSSNLESHIPIENHNRPIPWFLDEKSAKDGTERQTEYFESKSSIKLFELMRLLSTSLMLFHCTLNPLLYVCFSRDVRLALLCRRKRPKQPPIREKKRTNFKVSRPPSELSLHEIPGFD